MTVKELIEKLQKCNPNSTVYLETWDTPVAKVVHEYCDMHSNSSFIYIADDIDYIEEDILEDAIKIEEA
jgi:hypothetical protein